LKIPNETTLQAMQEAKNMDGEITSFDEIKSESRNA